MTDRFRFSNGLVTEFSIPEKGTDKAIILCNGVPSIPSKGKLIRFLVKRGFAVFHPRYAGTWESNGVFLERSPDEDVLALVDALEKPFTGLWGEETHTLQLKDIYVFGSSFGGPAAFLAACDPRVKKSVTFSPVVDWRARSREEPFDYFKRIVKEGYGGAYRGKEEHWNRLESGKFYNPVNHIKEIPGSKVLIIHAEDDGSVEPGPVRKFARELNCERITLKRGGHFGLSKAMNWLIWWHIKRFFNAP